MPYNIQLVILIQYLTVGLGLVIGSSLKTKGAISYLGSSTHITECDIGSNIILHCNGSGEPMPQILWLKDGRELTTDLSWNISIDRLNLISESLMEIDAGQYACIINNFNDPRELNTLLVVRTIPPKLENVTVHATTVVAIVHWHVSSDGGYPITHFTLCYRQDNSTNDTWHYPVPQHISPATHQFFVYQLKPDTAYMFRLWASNKLGSGEETIILASTTKPSDAPEVIQQMLHGEDIEDFSSTAWMVAVSMVMGTVLLLSCLSCILIYKEGRNNVLTEEVDDIQTHIISNPGFEIDLEESFLLDQADINCNIETGYFITVLKILLQY